MTEMTRVLLDYVDGRYSFKRLSEYSDKHEYEVSVPESTVRMWEQAASLDSFAQSQMRSFEDDRVLEREDET